jgi:hypothetical protein
MKTRAGGMLQKVRALEGPLFVLASSVKIYGRVKGTHRAEGWLARCAPRVKPLNWQGAAHF